MLPPIPARIDRTIPVSPQVFETRLVIVVFTNDMWSLAIEYFHRNQSTSVPTRLVLPEAVARATLKDHPITAHPYYDPDLHPLEV